MMAKLRSYDGLIGISVGAALLLCVVTNGCAEKSLPAVSIPSPSEEIVRIAGTTNAGHEFDKTAYIQTKKIIDRMDDPIALGELVAAFRSYDHQFQHDGRCATCERLHNAADHGLGRLSVLGTDAAAKELVRLWRDDQLQWDGASSVWIGTCITRMRHVILPHLQNLARDPQLGDQAQRYIACIHRDEDYGP